MIQHHSAGIDHLDYNRLGGRVCFADPAEQNQIFNVKTAVREKIARDLYRALTRTMSDRACNGALKFLDISSGVSSTRPGVVHETISEVTCEYWQILGFVVCIGMYGGMYRGTYWYILTWYALWHVLVCIIFGMYYIYVFRGHMSKYSYVLVSIGILWEIGMYCIYWYVLICMGIY